MIELVVAGPLRLQVREVKADSKNMARVHQKWCDRQGTEQRDGYE